MTPDVSLTTAELPRPPYCAGGCGASILDLIGDDDTTVDADELRRWTVTDNDDGYMSVWCPHYEDL
jgi:hypothetical protein